MTHAAAAPAVLRAPTKPPSWRQVLAPYARPRVSRSVVDVCTSVVPYVGGWVAMALLASVSPWLTLALAPLVAGFPLRTYILFHDCAHGSLWPSKRANQLCGAVLGLLVFSPYASWRHSHAVHHATAGDLDRRGVGDVPTKTKAEYHAMDRKGRFAYAAFRHPLIMFTIGPVWALVIAPRIPDREGRKRLRRSVHLTNLAIVPFVALQVWLVGWQTYLLVQGPLVLLAGSAGVFLFYVQHQFEDVYWKSTGDWDYADAALQGSSYLVLGPVGRFFTGNIGLHHVHHLQARIPNYNLKRAHDENPVFHSVPTLTLWQAVKTVNLKVYDEDRGRLVSFREARRPVVPRAVPVVQT